MKSPEKVFADLLEGASYVSEELLWWMRNNAERIEEAIASATRAPTREQVLAMLDRASFKGWAPAGDAAAYFRHALQKGDPDDLHSAYRAIAKRSHVPPDMQRVAGYLKGLIAYPVERQPDGRWKMGSTTSPDRRGLEQEAFQRGMRAFLSERETSAGGALPDVNATTKEAAALAKITGLYLSISSDVGHVDNYGWVWKPSREKVEKEWKASAKAVEKQRAKYRERGEKLKRDVERLQAAGLWTQEPPRLRWLTDRLDVEEMLNERERRGDAVGRIIGRASHNLRSAPNAYEKSVGHWFLQALEKQSGPWTPEKAEAFIRSIIDIAGLQVSVRVKHSTSHEYNARIVINYWPGIDNVQGSTNGFRKNKSDAIYEALVSLGKSLQHALYSRIDAGLR